jgi:hypothetical protein
MDLTLEKASKCSDEHVPILFEGQNCPICAIRLFIGSSKQRFRDSEAQQTLPLQEIEASDPKKPRGKVIEFRKPTETPVPDGPKPAA